MTLDTRRYGIVYGILTREPDGIMLGYVGKTRQRLEHREQQHRDSQSWGTIIHGNAFIIAEGFWTENELDAHEMHYIRHGINIGGRLPQRPLYNIVHNMDNPLRIPPWVAKEQRLIRDSRYWWRPYLLPIKYALRTPIIRTALKWLCIFVSLIVMFMIIGASTFGSTVGALVVLYIIVIPTMKKTKRRTQSISKISF